MAPSFEELADSSIPQSDQKSHLSTREKSRTTPLLIIVLICALCAAGYYHFSKPKLPVAARILLTANTDVLPHTLDSSTEFNKSFEYLKEGEQAPDYRETPEGLLSETLVTSDVTEATDNEITVSNQKKSQSVITEPVIAEKQTITLTQASVETTPIKLNTGSTKDWGGLVLVPDNSKLAKAYTSDVRLSRVEAHPIDGEKIRVWARIQNLTNSPISPEVGCEFRSSQNTQYSNANFIPSFIPIGGVIDVYFISPHERTESYTVMVKQSY